MVEALVVVGLLLVLAVAGGLSMLVSWQWLLMVGAGMTAFGALLGFPTGFYYHVVLRRHLLRRGPLPARWWANPVAHHAGLEPWELAQMRPYFHLGGLGFMLMMLGCLIAGIGVWMA